MNGKFLVVLTAMAMLAIGAPAFAEGAAVYKAKCAMCHGADGSGQTPVGRSLKLRDLGGPEVQKLTDAQLTAIITDGKEKMPAFKNKLTPAEITAQVALIRSFAK